MRQLVQTYNSSQGWAVVRVVNRLTSLDVILERNSEQGVSKDTVKATAKEVSKDTPTEKVVDADATTSFSSKKQSINSICVRKKAALFKPFSTASFAPNQILLL